MPNATTNGPSPSRIALNCAPLVGPFIVAGTSPPIALDPRHDIVCSADGVPLKVVSFSFDSVNNRYLIFASVQFDLQGVIQVMYHMPAVPFVDQHGTELGGFALIASFSPVGP
jgi:hypothetical protein